MAYHSTILRQIVAFLPRHEFESLAKDHQVGQRFRSFNRWSQFRVMFIGQLSGRKSLRDLVMNVSAQANKLYHLAIRPCSRATLAGVNEKQHASLYEAIFHKLLQRCRQYSPRHKFKFEGKLYLLDATVIDLCYSVFPWAKFRKAKGAKLHVGLDGGGYFPEFVSLTDGKTHESRWAKALNLPPGSKAVFDMGFTDYGWYQTFMENGVFFVTRLKSNAKIKYLRKRRGRKAAGITADQTIILLGNIPQPLHMVSYCDPETGKEYRFVTNADHLKAKTIADLYKERWQIELFFKWIKQNLKIKTFLGTSENAVLTQIWIALCVYLLLAFLKFKAKLGISMQQMLRLLQLNLFERCNLIELFKPPEPQPSDIVEFSLWAKL